MSDLTTSYFSIEKADRQADGTLMVYGKATDDSVDIDQQICDAAWLDRAMPAWFKSGGNIREQHSSIAAGVAKEYEAKADGHYIMAHVVDPVSVKKVDAGVLRGFSIGIKSPRVVRDQKAANGRIIDGQIVEVSLVDRPANPNCQLVLAKSVDGESSLVQVEELTEDIVKHPGHDQSSHGRGGGRAGAGAGAAGAAGAAGGGGGGSTGGGESAGGSSKPKRTTSKSKAGKTVDDAEDEMDEAYKKTVRAAGNNPTGRANVMDAAQTREDASGHIDDARNAIFRGNTAGAVGSLRNASKIMNDESSFKPAAKKLSDLASELEANPLGKSTNTELRKALQSALQSLSLNKSEETPMKDSIVELPTEAVGDLLKFDKIQYEAAREALANLIAVEAGEMREGHNELQSIAHLLEAVAHLHAWYEGEEAEGEVVEEETIIERAAGSDKEMKPAKDEKKPDFLKRCKDAGMDDSAAKACWDKYMGAETDTEKGAEPNPVPSQETYATLAGTVIVPPTETPKSAEAEEVAVEEAPAEEPAVEETPVEAPVEEAVTEDSEAKTEVDAADVEAIVEQVVKSATESLRAEIASLVAAKEAALEKSVGLESELAIAKSLAVAGGPSRTTKPLSTKINDNLTKAAIYKAKANATTDPVLAKGYKQLAEEFYSKAADSTNN
jgi:hypothetical protein